VRARPSASAGDPWQSLSRSWVIAPPTRPFSAPAEDALRSFIAFGGSFPSRAREALAKRYYGADSGAG
jgi:hypothetical protein